MESRVGDRVQTRLQHHLQQQLRGHDGGSPAEGSFKCQWKKVLPLDQIVTDADGLRSSCVNAQFLYGKPSSISGIKAGVENSVGKLRTRIEIESPSPSLKWGGKKSRTPSQVPANGFLSSPAEADLDRGDDNIREMLKSPCIPRMVSSEMNPMFLEQNPDSTPLVATRSTFCNSISHSPEITHMKGPPPTPMVARPSTLCNSTSHSPEITPQTPVLARPATFCHSTPNSPEMVSMKCLSQSPAGPSTPAQVMQKRSLKRKSLGSLGDVCPRPNLGSAQQRGTMEAHSAAREKWLGIDSGALVVDLSARRVLFSTQEHRVSELVSDQGSYESLIEKEVLEIGATDLKFDQNDCAVSKPYQLSDMSGLPAECEAANFNGTGFENLDDFLNGTRYDILVETLNPGQQQHAGEYKYPSEGDVYPYETSSLLDMNMNGVDSNLDPCTLMKSVITRKARSMSKLHTELDDELPGIISHTEDPAALTSGEDLETEYHSLKSRSKRGKPNGCFDLNEPPVQGNDEPPPNHLGEELPPASQTKTKRKHPRPRVLKDVTNPAFVHKPKKPSTSRRAKRRTKTPCPQVKEQDVPQGEMIVVLENQAENSLGPISKPLRMRAAARKKVHRILVKTSQDVHGVTGGVTQHQHQECKAIVLVPNRQRALVLQSNERRKPFKPKVQLEKGDLEWWTLVMTHGPTYQDKDEKTTDKWEEERSLFQQKALKFIRVMKEIQGSRGFSEWKGSVLDSIVGAFLTQNVSDHLSSSAFMLLASRYPAAAPQNFTEVVIEETDSTSTDTKDYDKDYFVEEPTTSEDHYTHEVPSIIPSSVEELEKEHCKFWGLEQENSNVKFESPKDSKKKGKFKIIDGLVNQRDPQDCNGSEGTTAARIDSTIEGTIEVDASQLPTENHSNDELQLRIDNRIEGTIEVDASQLPTEKHSSDNRIEGTIEVDASQLPTEKHSSDETQLHLPTEKHSSDETELHLPTEKHSSDETELHLPTEKRSRDETQLPLPNEKHSSDETQLQLPTESHSSPDDVGHSSEENLSILKEKVRLKGSQRAKLEQGKTKSKDKVCWEEVRKASSTKKCNEVFQKPGLDAVDWEAVNNADVSEIAEVIKERGMNNMLAGRIKGFLHRLQAQHGSLNLEWLRGLESEDAKKFLLSVYGLGLKSVECVRLLTLHHLAFPVDTNVGRICVRLGWVPIQPLPEIQLLSELETYPVQENIQKYLWPRLCTLDQPTLYELHYQMITFGKVFCTKRDPNCRACPLQNDCRHYADSVGRSKKQGIILPTPTPNKSKNPNDKILAILASEYSRYSNQSSSTSQVCEPIIEEPSSPQSHREVEIEPIIEEPCSLQSHREDEIEDIEDFMMDCHTKGTPRVHGHSSEIPSKALVVVPEGMTKYPAPKLKTMDRLCTIHYVYELRDDHPLVNKIGKRVADDPSPILLAIWGPGEKFSSNAKDTNNSEGETPQPSKEGETPQPSKEEETPQPSKEEETPVNNDLVKCTFLVPCRTANRGIFPLNGTYFQVNEVFADHKTSINPIEVSRKLLWNLTRRFVFFGTSVTSIFKGFQQNEIKGAFNLGYVCVRGYDGDTRAPKPLNRILHMSPSEIAKKRKMETKAKPEKDVHVDQVSDKRRRVNRILKVDQLNDDYKPTPSSRRTPPPRKPRAPRKTKATTKSEVKGEETPLK